MRFFGFVGPFGFCFKTRSCAVRSELKTKVVSADFKSFLLILRSDLTAQARFPGNKTKNQSPPKKGPEKWCNAKSVEKHFWRFLFFGLLEECRKVSKQIFDTCAFFWRGPRPLALFAVCCKKSMREKGKKRSTHCANNRWPRLLNPLLELPVQGMVHCQIMQYTRKYLSLKAAVWWVGLWNGTKPQPNGEIDPCSCLS